MASNTITLDPNDIWISGLDDNETNAVTHDDSRDPGGSRGVTESMIRNVKKFGVLMPVRVRKDGDYYVCVDGRGRILAAREANKRLVEEGNPTIKVMAVLERGNDDHVLGVMISSNEHRQDDTPMGKARKLQKLLARGYTEEESAEIFGVDLQTIKTWIPLLELDDSIQKAIDASKISAFAASPLAKLPRKEQKEEFKRIMEESGDKPITARQTRERVAETTGKTVSTAPPKRQVLRLLDLGISNLVEGGLSEDFIKGVRWAIGELATKSVSGLADLIKTADAKGAEKRAKRQPKAEKPEKAKGAKTKRGKGRKAPTNRAA